MSIFLNSMILCFFLVTSFTSFGLRAAFAENQSQDLVPAVNEEIRGEFGNWLQVCEKGSNHCVAVQFALDMQGNKAARFVLERLSQIPESPANAIITVFIPFESSIPVLPSGLSFAIDSNDPFTEQFLFCDQLGCTSQFGITDVGIDLLKKGANLTIELTDMRRPDSRYIVDLDLDQFTSIYDKLVSKNSG